MAGVLLPRAASKLVARDAARHHHIAEDEIDPLAGVEHRECGGPAVGLDDTIAEKSEAMQRERAQLGIVLDDKHGFPGGDGRCLGCDRAGAGLVRRRLSADRG